MDVDRLLVYAELALNLERRATPLPEFWRRVRSWKNPWTGLTAAVFRCEAEDKTVLAFRGVRVWNPRDLIGALIRRRCGYTSISLRLARSVAQEFGADLTIIGHSGGGGLASWLGGQLGVPSVTFNSGRTKWSLLNDGERQTNVCISGDFWGDPWNGLYGMPLPGQYLLLDRPEGKRETHAIPVVLAALRKKLREVESPLATSDGTDAAGSNGDTNLSKF